MHTKLGRFHFYFKPLNTQTILSYKKKQFPEFRDFSEALFPKLFQPRFTALMSTFLFLKPLWHQMDMLKQSQTVDTAMSDKIRQAELDLLQRRHSSPLWLADWKLAFCPEINIGPIIMACVNNTPTSQKARGKQSHFLCEYECVVIKVKCSTGSYSWWGGHSNLYVRWKQLPSTRCNTTLNAAAVE